MNREQEFIFSDCLGSEIQVTASRFHWDGITRWKVSEEDTETLFSHLGDTLYVNALDGKRAKLSVHFGCIEVTL